jgi:hypothetical protein
MIIGVCASVGDHSWNQTYKKNSRWWTAELVEEPTATPFLKDASQKMSTARSAAWRAQRTWSDFDDEGGLLDACCPTLPSP